MPTATSIAEIRNIESAINPAMAAQLLAFSVPTLVARSREDLPDSYALGYFTKGQASGHLHKLPAAIGGYEYDIFEDCVFTVELFSPRVSADPIDGTYLAAVYDRLGELALRARCAFSFNQRPAFNALLTWHHVDPMIPLADVIGFDEARQFDRHELRWRARTGIIPAAWPTDPAAYVLPATP